MPQGPRLPTSCRASQLLYGMCGNYSCCRGTNSEWVKVAPGRWCQRGLLGTFRPGTRLVCTTHCGVSFLRPAPKTSLEFLKRHNLRFMRGCARVLRKTKRKVAAEAAAQKLFWRAAFERRTAFLSTYWRAADERRKRADLLAAVRTDADLLDLACGPDGAAYVAQMEAVAVIGDWQRREDAADSPQVVGLAAAITASEQATGAVDAALVVRRSGADLWRGFGCNGMVASRSPPPMRGRTQFEDAMAFERTSHFEDALSTEPHFSDPILEHLWHGPGNFMRVFNSGPRPDAHLTVHSPDAWGTDAYPQLSYAAMNRYEELQGEITVSSSSSTLDSSDHSHVSMEVSDSESVRNHGGYTDDSQTTEVATTTDWIVPDWILVCAAIMTMHLHNGAVPSWPSPPAVDVAEEGPPSPLNHRLLDVSGCAHHLLDVAGDEPPSPFLVRLNESMQLNLPHWYLSWIDKYYEGDIPDGWVCMMANNPGHMVFEGLPESYE